LAISSRIEQTLGDFLGHVKIMMSGKLPGMLGYSWEGSVGPTHGTINFADASGLLVQLPVMLYRDFEASGHWIVAAPQASVHCGAGRVPFRVDVKADVP